MSFTCIDFFPVSDSDSDDCMSSIEECDRQLSQPDLTHDAKTTVLCLKAQHWMMQGQMLRALSCCNDALNHEPHSIRAIACRGLVNEHLGYSDVALLDYDRALSGLTLQPQHETSSNAALSGRVESLDLSPENDIEPQQACWLWVRKGHVQRASKHYSEALQSYNNALMLQPTSVDALSGRGTVLALSGRRRHGLTDCQRAVQLDPSSVTALNSLGIVLMLVGKFKEALQQFDQALDLQPTFKKAWNNRAIALSRLGRDADVLESLDHALSPESDTHESWYPSAWALKGVTHMKLGDFANAIDSCEQSQRIDPTLYNAALCKLMSLIASGRIINRFSKPESRQQLGHDLRLVFNALKFRLLALVMILGLLVLSNHTILAGLQSILPTLLSVGIIGLIAADLWANKSKLGFVWRIYACSGILTYVRAIGILVVTLTTFAIAEQIVPPFMLWGWASSVFGQAGNLIFQPFNLLNFQGIPDRYHAILNTTDVLLGMIHPMRYSASHLSSVIGIGTPAHATVQFSFSLVFIICFWLMLMVGIPFWARLEERIFRQGANSWRQICIRSVQFGLVHLLVGIPILAGFVLIVPGFLFACRYKYVYSAYLKRHRNPLKAQEAGMLASTADHAVYNAILVTIFVVTLAISNVIA